MHRSSYSSNIDNIIQSMFTTAGRYMIENTCNNVSFAMNAIIIIMRHRFTIYQVFSDITDYSNYANH